MKNSSPKKLLNLYGKILEELIRRKVVRTRNAPVADYAEWLAAKVLKLRLENSSKSGHDAVGAKGKRYQIKCRRLLETNGSTQLGVIRNLDKDPFDLLIAIIFDAQFDVQQAYEIPRSVIKKYAKYSKHQNGYILYARDGVLQDKKVRNITSKFKMKVS